MFLRSSHLARQVLFSIGVIAVLVVTGFLLTRKARSAPNEAAPPALDEAVTVSRQGESIAHIEMEKVRREALSGDIQATGQVLYPPDQTVRISPRLQGRIQQVLVRVGDHVTAGQPLAILESVDAATAQSTVRQNENKLRLAKLNLERQERLYRLGTPDVTTAQASLDQARARTQYTRDALQRMKEQARIGGFSEKPVEDAETALVNANSDLAQAQADLAQAQRDHDRKARLVEIGVAARSDLEAAENVLEKARVAARADQEKVSLARQAAEREKKAFASDLYSQQQIRSAESDFRQAQLQEEAAHRALLLARAAIQRDVQQARSDYEAALADYENAHRVLSILGHPDSNGRVSILAPISGVITDRQVSPGQIVDQSQMTPWQMFVLSNTDRVYVDADVYEKDIRAVAPGMAVQIHVGAFPDQEFRGVIRHIAPTLDPKTRAIKVRAEIANRAGSLKDGMYADVTISLSKGRPVLTAPASAVQHDGDHDYVYIKTDGKYARRQVELGPHRNGRYVIVKGVREGELIVSHGSIFLDNQASGG